MDGWRNGAARATQQSFADLGRPLFETTFVVLDFETTGLSPTRDRITEIGAVKVCGGQTIGELQSLVHPEIAIPPAVSALTGISDRLVADHPPIEAALPALLEFLRGTVIVAHNAHFDLAFLRAACERASYPLPAHEVICTARLARRLLGRREVRSFKLEVLAAHLRARVTPSHRALPDARATVDVFHGLLERAGSIGVATLEELREYTRSTSDSAYRKVSLVDGAPDEPGVYRFMGARDEVLYVGKAKALRRRLRTYFGQDPRRKVADLVRETERVEWCVTPTELEASVRELREIRACSPRYNRRSRRSAPAVYVKLTQEAFPRLSIVTKVRDEALYVGPLPSRRAAQRFLETVHDVIPLRQCTDRLSPTRPSPACVLKDIGRCGAPCDGSQDVEDYRAPVQAFRDAMTTHPDRLLTSLRDRMETHAQKRRFEDAAQDRRRLYDAARTLRDQRRLTSLVAADEIVACRITAASTEVVHVHHGRLGATTTLPPHASPQALERAATALRAGVPERCAPGPLPREEWEEVALVAEWLEGPEVRVVSVTGTYAEPWAGGAVVEATIHESRRVARAVRRDHALLDRAKIVARTPAGAEAEAHAIGAPSAARSSTSSR